jgi:hypothetical protein
MHRFGRSAQQKMADRWGGGFIVATLLALLAVWLAYDGFKNMTGLGGTPTGNGKPGITDGTQGGTTGVSLEPQEFKLYFVQVGAFRSTTKAVREMTDLGYTPVVAPRSSTGTIPVYIGPYSDAQAADAAIAKLAEGGKPDYATARRVELNVAYNPEAVPTIAGEGSADLKAGLDQLNTYLHEVAVWLQSRSENPSADAGAVAHHAQSLADQAQKLNAHQNTAAKELANLLSTASTHAAAVEAVSMQPPTSAEYQAAMTEYLSLVKSYNSLQASKP